MFADETPSGGATQSTHLIVDGLGGWRRSQRLVDAPSGVVGHGLMGVALRPEALRKHALLVIEILKAQTQNEAAFFRQFPVKP